MTAVTVLPPKGSSADQRRATLIAFQLAIDLSLQTRISSKHSHLLLFYPMLTGAPASHIAGRPRPAWGKRHAHGDLAKAGALPLISGAPCRVTFHDALKLTLRSRG